MGKNMVVLVATSEATWQNLPNYCFNANLMENRRHFDLAVVCNGESDEAVEYLRAFSPEYLFVRPNFGRDPAAFDFLVKNVELTYESYLFMHDDHWFADRDWLDTLQTSMDANPDIDAFGNLVDVNYLKPTNFETISTVLGYEAYHQEDFPFFLQGMAGVYRKGLIETLVRVDGVPHIHGNDKEVGEVCERLLSFLLLKLGFGFAQIPPGYEMILRHRDHPGRPGSPNGLRLT